MIQFLRLSVLAAFFALSIPVAHAQSICVGGDDNTRLTCLGDKIGMMKDTFGARHGMRQFPSQEICIPGDWQARLAA